MAGKPTLLTSLDYSDLRPHSLALFLDFDGTLADFAERPDDVSVPPSTRKVLARLVESTQGALAIVTGRPIDDIDRMLAPLSLPVAGVHGLERRNAAGEQVSAEIDDEKLASIGEELQSFLAENPGTMLEPKKGSLALHYRSRPELAEEAQRAVRHAVEGRPGLHVLNGKMVIEIKSGKATKADAVAAFMSEPPFAGRLPIFAGDDVTDEDAFREISRIKGISIKVGSGDTAASFRTEGTDSFREWLARLADSFESNH